MLKEERKERKKEQYKYWGKKKRIEWGRGGGMDGWKSLWVGMGRGRGARRHMAWGGERVGVVVEGLVGGDGKES